MYCAKCGVVLSQNAVLVNSEHETALRSRIIIQSVLAFLASQQQVRVDLVVGYADFHCNVCLLMLISGTLIVHTAQYPHSMRRRVYETVERSSVCLSVRPFVGPIDRQQQRLLAGLLLSAPRAGDIGR